MSKSRIAPSSPLIISARDWHPEAFQKRGAKFLLEHAAAALFLDPGMRKTSTTLAAFKILKNEGVAERALVIAPKRVCQVTWPDEIEKWTDFAHLRWAILRGGSRESWVDADADIFLINPESLEWLLTDPATVTDSQGDKIHYRVPTFERLKRLGVDTLIVDESTKFKNTGAARFKYLKAWLHKFQRRWILTGTPAPKGYLDLYPQMYLCDMGATLGPYITHYRKTYFLPTGFGGHDWKLKDGADARIIKALKPHVFRLDAGDYLKLPKLNDNPVQFNLNDEAREAYDSMEDELFASFDAGKETIDVTANSGSVAMMKCEQIASGAVYRDGPKRTVAKERDVIVVHNQKMEVLHDLLEQQQGHPLLILYWFNHEGRRLFKDLPKGGGWLGDEGSANESRRIVHAWNNDQLPWLLGHPASMGHGLNLQEGSANALAWYTLPWSAELYEQTWRRLVRSGSKHEIITNHLLIARNTIDVVKYRVQRDRASTQKKFLDALRSYRRGNRSIGYQETTK